MRHLLRAPALRALALLGLLSASLPSCGTTTPPANSEPLNEEEVFRELQESPVVAAVIEAMAAHGCSIQLDEHFFWTWSFEGTRIAHGFSWEDCTMGDATSIGHFATLVRELPGAEREVTAVGLLTPTSQPELPRTLVIVDVEGAVHELEANEELFESIRVHLEAAAAAQASDVGGSVGSLRMALGDPFTSLFGTGTESACAEALGQARTNDDTTCCGCMSDIEQCSTYTSRLADEMLNCQIFLDCVAEAQESGARDDVDDIPAHPYEALQCPADDMMRLMEEDHSLLDSRGAACYRRVVTLAGSTMPSEFGQNPANFAAKLRQAISIMSGGVVGDAMSLAGAPWSTASTVASIASAGLGLAAKYESNMERMLSMGALDRASSGNLGSQAQYYCYRYRGPGSVTLFGGDNYYSQCENAACSTNGGPRDECAGIWAQCRTSNDYRGAPHVLDGECDNDGDGVGDEPWYSFAPWASDPFGSLSSGVECCESNLRWGWLDPSEEAATIFYEVLHEYPVPTGTCRWYGRTQMDYWGRSCTWSPDFGPPMDTPYDPSFTGTAGSCFGP